MLGDKDIQGVTFVGNKNNKFQIFVQLKNKKISRVENTLEEAKVKLIEILKLRDQEIKEETEISVVDPIETALKFYNENKFYL